MRTKEEENTRTREKRKKRTMEEENTRTRGKEHENESTY